jgi:hypothetical protein
MIPLNKIRPALADIELLKAAIGELRLGESQRTAEIEALKARVAALEAKRGPGRPKTTRSD